MPFALFATTKQEVDAVLTDFCAFKIKRAATQGPHYSSFWQAIAGLLQAGGKRMRPFLTVQAYQMFGGQNREGIMAVAAAQELLHLSMLIHDDIIDRDEVRYGTANITGHYRQVYGAHLSGGELTHYANAAALLAGDAVLSAAYSLVLDNTLGADEKVVAAKLLAESVFAVVGGELLDSESVLQDITASDPLLVAHYKTAIYSFVGPLLSGAELAQAPLQASACLRAYGTNLGIAFQLADDILGVFGDEVVTGKSSASDIAEGKRTYLLQQAFLLANHSQRRELQALIGKPDITPAQIARAKAIVHEVNAVSAVRAKISDYVGLAAAALEQLHCSPAAKQPLVELLTLATEREQ